MKKSLLLILLLTTSGCDIIGFNRGANYIEPLKFKYDYDKKTKNIFFNTSREEKISVYFYTNACGGYGLMGIVIPIIPVWDNFNCQDLVITINSDNSSTTNTSPTKITKFLREEKDNKIYLYIPGKNNNDNGTISIIDKYAKELENVYVVHQNKIYKPSKFNNETETYTFAIHTKSLSDGATLVIKKNEETFEIPFRYQHTFSFELWGA